MILIALTKGVCAIQHEPTTTSRASVRVGAKEGFIVMLRGYFDDSGTHVGGGAGASRLVVVGGVLVACNNDFTSIKRRFAV